MARKAEATADAAAIFAALGDPLRLRVVARLSAAGPLSITGLTEGTRVTRQAVTKHLHALSGAGLVRDRRHGRERIWELDARGLEAAHGYLDRVSAQWDQVLNRLRHFVEER